MVQVPHADPGPICPLHKKDVSKVCHKCPWWYQVFGKHPQTGDKMDGYACAIAVLPALMLENSRQSRDAGAAVENMRNEITDRMDGKMKPSNMPRMLEG